MIDQDRPTTRKSRVIAHNQQIVRYDVERRAELKPAMQRRILRYVESRLRGVSCPSRGVGLCQGVVSAHAHVGTSPGSPQFEEYPWSSIRKLNTSATTRRATVIITEPS